MEIYVDLRTIDLKPFILHIHHLLSNITCVLCSKVSINEEEHMLEY